MAPYGFAITKKVTWRGIAEEFSNVYHYDAPAGVLDSALESVADGIVTEEKKVHTSAVTFVRARVWGPTDQGPGPSETRVIKDLSGAGNMLAGGDYIYMEAAVVVQWYIGRSSLTGRKRFLRKFIHSMALPSSTTGRLGDVAIGSANKTVYTTYGNAVKTLTVGAVGFDLCTPDGDHLPLGTSPQILDYLHVRQFKQ